jgi:hypothetical protein
MAEGLACLIKSLLGIMVSMMALPRVGHDRKYATCKCFPCQLDGCLPTVYVIRCVEEEANTLKGRVCFLL